MFSFRSNLSPLSSRQAIARLNHSCCPNAQQTHIPETGEEVLYASRDIEVGEEINDCYIELRKKRSERRRELKEVISHDDYYTLRTFNMRLIEKKHVSAAFSIRLCLPRLCFRRLTQCSGRSKKVTCYKT